MSTKEPKTRHRLSKVAGSIIVLAAMTVLGPIPALLATRHEYTWSLFIFLFPVAVLAIWYLITPEREIGKFGKAFRYCFIFLFALGAVLDLFWADEFFTFSNKEAVWLPSIPALDISFRPLAITAASYAIPLEEFIFYGAGFLAMLLIYIWGDEYFFKRYNDRDYVTEARGDEPLFSFSVPPLVVASLLVAAGFAYKAARGGGGVPGYLLYLVALPTLLILLWYPATRRFINWQAFSFMFLYMLGVGVLWEVTLAAPDGWWGYQHQSMVGMFVEPWHDLPIEAVMVWFLAAITTVATFERLKIFFSNPNKTPRLFGRRRRGDPSQRRASDERKAPTDMQPSRVTR